MLYHIVTILPDKPRGEVFTISHDLPRATSPETHGQVVYLPGCRAGGSSGAARNILARVYHHPNEPVHTDSCFEAFINCFPICRSMDTSG
ncbi:MAG: hypothetical protein R2912_09520 [Eubacteriales bacterium]